ncbi:MAG: acyltransferase [Gammaproteobacteria bacterium]|nr:acyltransferase [Gammaproteobacteria bacterium]
MKKRLLLNALKFIALDIPVYRELLSRFLSFFSPLIGLSPLRIENYIRGMTYKKNSNGNKIQVGRYVVINAGFGEISFSNGVYINNYCNLTADYEGGYIRIGERSHIDVFSALHGQGGISIGNKCAIASGVVIYSQSNQYKDDNSLDIIDQPIVFKSVVIESDVWIGANATILPGITIGRGAIIGAGSVVNKNVAAYEIVAGVPARTIGKRDKV